MKNPPIWFYFLVAVALLWNLAGLFAVFSDLRLTADDLAAMPAKEQAMYVARPLWSIVASVVAVVGGTVGCAALLTRMRWTILALYLSLVGIVLQDIGLFLVVGNLATANQAALILQGIVLLVAVGLIMLARLASNKSWLRVARSIGSDRIS